MVPGLLVLLPFLLLAGPARAQAPSHEAQLERFLVRQAQDASGAPAEAVRVRLPASVRALPACDSAQPFVPTGGKPWGEVLVGLRCAPASGPGWTRYVQARVDVRAPAVVAARALPAGHRLSAPDLALADADLARAPADGLREPEAAVGALTLQPLAAGAALRRAHLRAEVVIQPGQPVRVESAGPGFLLTAQGKALGAAAAGARVKLQMEGGRVVSGQAQADGSVRVDP